MPVCAVILLVVFVCCAHKYCDAKVATEAACNVVILLARIQKAFKSLNYLDLHLAFLLKMDIL